MERQVTESLKFILYKDSFSDTLTAYAKEKIGPNWSVARIYNKAKGEATGYVLYDGKDPIEEDQSYEAMAVRIDKWSLITIYYK